MGERIGGTPIETVPSPSPSQARAIEADPGALLVLAGPGAGKTYCLTERIRFLIERHGYDPARICAFTFTNKAAGEIAHRLETHLGPMAERVKRGTIHAFCAELLRELGASVLLEPGFGIADEEYQLTVLRRIEGPRRWHRSTLTRFGAHRLRGDNLTHEDLILFEQYERFLAARRLVDFDTLVIKAAELLERPEESRTIRSRWDVILVDEFQDLNPVQYRIVRALAADHRHVFAVGDHEQSIYSWAGADPGVFKTFTNDFDITSRIHLEENRRCPRDVFAMARRLVTINTPLFADLIVPHADRISPFPILAHEFDSDDHEAAWLVDDIRKDLSGHGLRWGDAAVLYRKHEIGQKVEGALLNAGIPCRLAQGRALAEDPAIAYVIAAARVIAHPDDTVYRDAFFRVLLPGSLFDEAAARAEAGRVDLRKQLASMASTIPRAVESGRKIRRALAEWRNLAAVGKQHSTLASLIQDLLSRRVGRYGSALEERHDEITDPLAHPDVVALAGRLRGARERRRPVTLARMGGMEIALKGVLTGVGVTVEFGGVVDDGGAERQEAANEGAGGAGSDGQDAGAFRIGTDETPSVGTALGVFKAAQLLEVGDTTLGSADFTAIDLETTERDTERAEIVEIAAVRVRRGEVVETFDSLVRPRKPISQGATDTHGLREADVAGAPYFEEVWPRFREFCGDDVIVAHNGYAFDFRILARMSREIGAPFGLCTYDTLPLARDLYPTSRKLVDLARQFGIPSGQSHRALDDTKALAHVFLALEDAKAARARKTALSNLLDHLGVALALCDEGSLSAEARMFRHIARPFALGRYSNALEHYEREHGGDPSRPMVDEVIESLGGVELMARIRSEKSANDRYPAAMSRLRRILAAIPSAPLDEQLRLFLERVVLSKWDGLDPETSRVNLLTLHSTKGLEFSRVYIVGVEDAQLPGAAPGANPKDDELEEARRLLYVGMTRTIDRLVLTRATTRDGRPSGGHRFLDEMELAPIAVSVVSVVGEGANE